MKQKYTILKDKNSGNLKIQEYAELDKEIFSLVCEETYETSEIKSAASAGKLKLIAKLRTPNLYPIASYADKIADAVMGLFQKDARADEPVDLLFDDVKIMKKAEDISEEVHKTPASVIDDLLEPEEFVDDISVDEAQPEEEQDDLDMFDEEKDE